MNILDTVLWSVGIAFMTALVALAYNNPSGYSKLMPWLCGLLFLMGSTLGSWDLAINYSLNRINESKDITTAAASVKSLGFGNWLPIFFIIGNAFLCVLLFLDTLKEPTNSNKQ